jgi:hypothetical protein
MIKFHQQEKNKLKKEIEDQMVYIAVLGEYLKEYEEELKNLKEINEELLKVKEELKNMNNSNTIENQNLKD